MIIKNTIDIAAGADVVWRVTCDVERWPDWSPTISAVTRLDTGPFRLGSTARIRQPMQPPAVWTVTSLDEGTRFAWTTQRAGLRMTGAHEVVPMDGRTRSILTLEATGALAVLLWPLLRPVIGRALRTENRALKARCEPATT